LTKSKKIGLSVILVLSGILTGVTFSMYTTAPGLHYLLVFFDSIGILILGGIGLFITLKSKELLWVSIMQGAVGGLTSLILLVDGDISDTTIVFGLIISTIGLITHLVALILTWKMK
jgi:hypothetical protein